MSVANLTKYYPSCQTDAFGTPCAVMIPSTKGYVKFEEAMEASSNSIQQLKVEILPILYQAVGMLRDYKREDVIIILDNLTVKLSAV